MMMTIDMPIKDWSEAADILTLDPIDLSILLPCLVNKVEDCANTMAYIKHVAHVGANCKTVFASST